MKIIQSFYQIDDKTCYNAGNNSDNYLINFYSLLLSYATLKKLYGHVTMYCNEDACDKMLKYIPYDDIVKTNPLNVHSGNYRNEWGLLKFHVFGLQKEPFIHVDGDVFIFKDLFSHFINDKSYKCIVQSIEIDKKYAIYDTFYFANKDKLINIELVDESIINESYQQYGSIIGYNNGVIGFNDMKFMRKYIKSAMNMNELINSGELIAAKHQTMIFEQFLLYLLAQKNKINVFKVLPSDDIKDIGYNETGKKHGYTHLLSGNKYVGNFVMLVRNKILKDFPEYASCIERFEESICDANIVLLKHKNESMLMKNIVKEW